MLLSRQTAREALKSAQRATEFEFRHGKVMPADLGITGSTFRAYRNCSSSPSEIYRAWAVEKGFRAVALHPVTTREEFLSLHKSLTSSFEKSWNRSGCRPLTFAEKYKVVDLFTKALAFSKGHECEESRFGLYRFANIPLDKFSLLAVSKLFYGIVVDDSPRMGHIKDIETYDFLQSQIFQLTCSAEVPNLAFDHYAWNLTH